MKKTFFSANNGVELRQRRKIMLTFDPFEDDYYKLEKACLAIENKHNSEILDNVMRALVNTNFIADFIKVFQELLSEIKGFRQLYLKADYFLRSLDFSLKQICNELIETGRTKDLRLNLILHQEDIEKPLNEVLINMQDTLAGRINPFAIPENEMPRLRDKLMQEL